MSSRKTGLRFDLIELVTITLFCGFVGMWIGSSRVRFEFGWPSEIELAPLAARFGPHHESQFFEEWILRDFFQDKKAGFFVDVGASDPKRFSNTYFLEKQLGWSGIAIDALPQFEEEYRRYRPRTRFFAFFVSDRSDQSATLHVLSSATEVSSEDQAFTARWGSGAEEIQVRTVTLDDLLSAEKVESIDLLSMDIELAEPKALAGFSVSRFRPALVCIEAHPEVRQAILDYFAGNGYVLVGKYLRADLNNLYFAPLH